MMGKNLHIAETTDSGNLQIKRTLWVMRRGDRPLWRGKAIDPRSIPARFADERDTYQEALRAWYLGLSVKAQTFLGLEWCTMCDPPLDKPRQAADSRSQPEATATESGR